MQYGIMVKLEFYPAWLRLARTERRDLAQDMYGIIGRYAGKVEVEFYDADALHGGFTDFVICRTEDMKHYHYMWEEIRDTRAYAGGYVKIVDVTIGIRDAHRAYEAEALGMDED
ncbi:MAG: Darcynin 2 [Paenibacillaceae bacterium]|nr:Darcynin 2 [Paenibacillaceae bacterium]